MGITRTEIYTQAARIKVHTMALRRPAPRSPWAQRLVWDAHPEPVVPRVPTDESPEKSVGSPCESGSIIKMLALAQGGVEQESSSRFGAVTLGNFFVQIELRHARYCWYSEELYSVRPFEQACFSRPCRKCKARKLAAHKRCTDPCRRAAPK